MVDANAHAEYCDGEHKLGEYLCSDERIKKLENEIELEQMQYDIACEHPTETAQYYSALNKQGMRLKETKQKLSVLKSKN